MSPEAALANRAHRRAEAVRIVRARLVTMGATIELDALDNLSAPELDVLVYLEAGQRTRDQAVPNGPGGASRFA